MPAVPPRLDPVDRDRIVAALQAAGYTPGRRDLATVVALAALTGDRDEALALRAARALLRAEAVAAVAATRAGLDAALARGDDGGAAARLVAALGQLARAGGDAPAAPAREAAATVRAVLAADGTPPRARRAAIVALGKLGGDDARDALCALWDRGGLPADQRRALVEALGKVGGDDARARLDASARAAASGDPGGAIIDRELARRRDRAVLMAERDAGRDVPSTIRADVAVPEAATVVARCRRGLEGLLGDELAAAGLAVAAVAPGAVRLGGGAPLAALTAARLWLTVGIELPLAADAKGTGAAGDADATLPARLAATLAAPPTRALLTALTDGPVRWRLALGGAGHRRAVVWRAAQAVRAAAPELINDPKATTWDVVVDAARTTVELRPHKLDDPRFAWRVADVPASSHPTVAAALARLAGARAADVVWDPFCGSGAELIERARLGPWRRLVGSDLDDRALAAARANLAAAGLADRAELIRADALAHDPGGVTLIITNPPLGRRIRGDAAALLEQFVTRAARLLAPDGRLVWITPAVRRTHDAAIRAGLYRDVHHIVDLGGYDGDLEVWRPTSGLARGRHRPAS